MVNGFFAGGLAGGLDTGLNDIAKIKYQQGLMQLEQQRLQQQDQNSQRTAYMDSYQKFMDNLNQTVDADKIGTKELFPHLSDDKINEMVLKRHADQIAQAKSVFNTGFQHLGMKDQPAIMEAQIGSIFQGPPSTATLRAKAEATGTYGETQAKTEEAKARTGYLNRGGSPMPDNPDGPAAGEGLGDKASFNQRFAQVEQTPAAPAPTAMATDQGGAVLNRLAKTSGLLPEALDAAGRAWAGGNTLILSNFGRGKQGPAQLSAIKQWGLYSLAHDSKLTPQQTADQLNFNVQNFKGDTAAQQTIGRRSGQFALAENEFEQVSGLVRDASKNVPRTQYKAINEIMNAWREGTGDPAIVQFGASINSAINVYARAISPTGQPTVSDKDHAREILQKGWANNQIDAALDQLDMEVAAAKKSIPAAKKQLRGGQSNVPPPPPGFNVLGQ